MPPKWAWKKASYDEINAETHILTGEEEKHFFTHLPSARVNGKGFPSHHYFPASDLGDTALPWFKMLSATIKG